MDGIGAVAERFLLAVLDRGDLSAVEEIFSPDHVLHYLLLTDLPDGHDGVRQLVTRKRRAFPDLVVRVDELLVHDLTVVARATLGGTNTGESMVALPTTGKSAMTQGIYWFRFREGRVAETWVGIDCLVVALQTGAVIPSGERLTTPDPGWI